MESTETHTAMEKKGVTMSQKSPQLDAVDWLVLQDSGFAEGREAAQHWEEWCSDPDNRAGYVYIKQFVRDLRKLPPPRLPTREELLADANADKTRDGFH
jgi:ferric-dicitrate binding protein FerR (iron transport regulator)